MRWSWGETINVWDWGGGCLRSSPLLRTLTPDLGRLPSSKFLGNHSSCGQLNNLLLNSLALFLYTIKLRAYTSTATPVNNLGRADNIHGTDQKGLGGNPRAVLVLLSQDEDHD